MLNSGKSTKLKNKSNKPLRIIISRTDNLGDVVLTLPMATLIKKILPNAFIIFLGKKYTQEIVKMSGSIDLFIDWDKLKRQTQHARIRNFKKLKADYIFHVFPDKKIASLAKKCGIRNRCGTTGRIFHWFSCNRLVPFTRKRSNLHESQLNLKLLKPLGFKNTLPLGEIKEMYNITPPNELPEHIRNLIDNNKFNLILHPKTKGSAREWGFQNFNKLIELLPEEKFKIFITGSQEDSETIRMEMNPVISKITDLSGRFTIDEFLSFISNTDGLVACSTGPLHIAAAMNKFVVGIYPPIRPMHPGRWAPVGPNASYLVSSKNCKRCRKSTTCECIQNISPEMVLEQLLLIFKSDKNL